MTTLTHTDLVEIGARWLRRKYPVVVTEIATWSREIPDAIGFRYRESCLVECKASRADFLADLKKRKRWGKYRLGMGTLRYYLCQPGIIDVAELPEGWGLLEAKSGRVRVKLHGMRNKRNKDAETTVLLSIIRRLGIHSHDGVSIRVYTEPTGNRTALHVRQESLPMPRCQAVAAKEG